MTTKARALANLISSGNLFADGQVAASEVTGLHTVATTGSYADLVNKPTVVSHFTNDANYASTTYVNTQMSNMVASAPATLDTLNELAAALGNDANFSTTTATALGNRLRVDTAAQSLTSTQKTNAKTNLDLQNVENKSSATIRGELTSSNVTTALGFTPYNSTNPNAYISGNQTITFSGDATGSGAVTVALTLANSGVTAGTYGSSTNIPQLVVDAKGRVTSVSNVAVSIPSGALTFTGDVTGSGSTGSSTALTLANSGVTAGTYTKVTVDAKGRVTTGTTLASADLPTYTGSLTSAQVTGALGFTPYNSTNPSGYITNTGNARVGVENNGTLVGTRRNINFIPGTGVSLTITDDSANEEVDVTVTNTGVTSVSGTGTVSGLTLTGTVTTTGSLTLGGTLTLTSAQITTGLGFTPYNSTNPSGYITTSALSGYLTSASAASTYLTLSGGTVTGDLLVQGGSSRFPSHFFHYEYDAAGNVYEHYYAPGSENVKNSSANLRVSSTSGFYKVLSFSGDGTFQWNSQSVLHAGNFSSYSLPLTGGTLTGGLTVSSGNLIVNQSSVSYSTMDNTPVIGSITTNRLHVNGSIQLTNNDDAIVFGRGTATFLKDEELGFGWGGGWFMTDGDWIRARNSKNIYSGSGIIRSDSSVRGPIFYDQDDTGYYLDPTSSSRLANIFAGNVSSSNDGSWNARLNLVGSSHARLDVVSNSDGIITTMYSHTGQGAGRIGTYSNHPLILMAQGGSVGGWAYNGSLRSPIFYDSDDTGYYGDFASTSRLNQLITAGRVVIGGNFSNNSYASVSSTRLLFGGGDDPDNYFIGTNLENYGGNYTKLDLRWHTGIRMGAQQQYGGIRFFDSEDLGTQVFAISKDGAYAQANQSMRAPIFYDIDNTSYYLDPTSTTALRTVGSWRADAATWDGEFAGKIQYHSNNWYLQFSSNMIFRNSGGSNIMTCDSSGNVTFSGNVGAYSDRNKKTNITTLTTAQQYFDKIDAKNYVWKDTGKEDIGFIAQDVEAAGLHMFVHNNEVHDPNTGEIAEVVKSLDYGKMVAVLWQTVKELKQELDALKSKQ